MTVRNNASRLILLLSLPTLSIATVRAQDATAQDAQIDTIRRLSAIGANDQERIRDWIQDRVDELSAMAPSEDRTDGFNAEAFKAFRDRVGQQLSHVNNTPAFTAALTNEMVTVANAEFGKAGARSTVSRSIARALVDMDRPETVPGLIAGVASSDDAARSLCVRGLVMQRSVIAQDKNLLGQMARAVQAAGVKESSPVVLGRLYEAIAITSDVGAVFGAFTAIFDARLASLGAGAVKVDGAEIFALQFFIVQGVQAGLDANQKAELVRRLAVFLRAYAQRYNDPAIVPAAGSTAPDLGYYEREKLERLLVLSEEVLEGIVGTGKGGTIRDVLGANGFDGRADVLREARRWVGSADGNTRGALNDAPWNVPIGAP